MTNKKNIFKRGIVIFSILLIVIITMAALYVYKIVILSNTSFAQTSVDLYIPTGSNFDDVKKIISPYIEDENGFELIAEFKKYVDNVKPGRYIIKKGMGNNSIINTLRSKNTPIRLTFNNKETLESLAGAISKQIEADSIELLNSFYEPEFLTSVGMTPAQSIALYIPNTYEFFWNTSADKFRDHMVKEYNRFWNEDRTKKAIDLGLSPLEVSVLASIVHKESARADERPTIAGVYINRLKKNMKLQADPTVIYAIKTHLGNNDTIIKRVLYKDLKIDSPYNTYMYAGLPPAPITMPDMSAIKAVLNPERHDYLFFVADPETNGYHKFAKTIQQHNINKQKYIKWINEQHR